MDIGRKIKFFRKEKNISQSTLAHELCSVSYLSKIENNLVIPNVELVENLFKRLQITSINLFDTQTLLSQLKNWNYNILQQNESAAKKSHLLVQKKINFVDDPYYILLFKLFELHYFIDMQNFTLADERIKELDQYEEFLEAELEFYYLKFRGLYLYHKSDKLGALESYKKAVILKNSFSLQDWEIAYLYYFLALVAFEIREDVFCIYYYNQASTLFEQQNNSSMIARGKNVYGMILQRLKLFDEAFDAYSYALDHCYNVGNMKLLIKIHINLGKLYSDQSQSEKAIEHFKKSIDLLDETDWLIAKIEPIYLLVNEYYNINADLKCIYWIEIANKIISEQNYNTEHIIHLKILEFILAKKTDSAEFKIYLRNTAIPFFKKYNQWENIARYSNILGNYFQRQKKYKNAAHYYKMSNESLQKLILSYKSLRICLEKTQEFKMLSGSL